MDPSKIKQQINSSIVEAKQQIIENKTKELQYKQLEDENLKKENERIQQVFARFVDIIIENIPNTLSNHYSTEKACRIKMPYNTFDSIGKKDYVHLKCDENGYQNGFQTDTPVGKMLKTKCQELEIPLTTIDDPFDSWDPDGGTMTHHRYYLAVDLSK